MNTEDNGQLNFAASIDNEKLRSDAAESKNILHSIGQKAATESAAIDAAFSKIGAAVGGIFTLAQAASFAKKIVDVRGEIESLSISFETLLGSKTKAEDLFSSIRKFAVETPMQLNDLAKAAQTMLSFNIDDGKIMTYLKALGDISMGDSQKFNSLTLAFSQMSATGKLMGQDLLQMINAGFNPLATISEQTGKSIAALKKEMEGGAISAQMVQNAFVAAASEGGKYNNMLLSQSKSINGAISNLQGAFDDMLNEIGTKSQGIISGTIDTATTMVKNYQDVAEAITAVIAVCGSYKAAIAVNEAVTRLCAQAHEEQAAAFIAEYEAQMATVNAKPAEISAGQASVEVTLKEAIAKSQLTEAEAAHVLAVYQETEAEVNALKTAAAAAETRLAEAAATEEAAAAHVKAAEEKYIAAFKAGDATAREAAASEVAAAKDELAAASKAKLTASTEANTASSKANAAALALESTKVEITTTKTTVLTAAKNALTAATKRLYATITAHPYALVLAAVVALAYGIYKVATYQSDWQKAQEKLNDATKECNKSIASERVQADQLFAKLRAAKTGTEAYAKAKTDILNKYGKYLNGLNEEIKTLQDVEGAYKAVTKAAKESAQARAMEKFKTEAADTYASVEADQREEIYKLMQKKFRGQKNTSGGSYAEDMFAQVIAAIENGNSVDEGLLRKFDKKNFIIDTEGGNSYEYITNDLQDILNKINVAKDTYNKTMQEAERRFGKVASEEGGGETTKEETKDKEYWDKKKKEAQKELEALTVEEANSQKGLEIKKRISEIQKKIDSYSTSKGESAGKKANQQQAEADKRLQEIEAAKKAQEKATAAAALELEQQQLDLEEDSVSKQLRQIDINSRRMEAALEDRRDALLEVYRDILEKEWQNANPNAKDKGMIFDRSSVTREQMQEDMDLPGNEYLKAEWASIEASGKVISDIIAKQTQDVYKSILSEIQTYNQQYQQIQKEFQDKRDALYETDENGDKKLRNGVTQENVDELDRQETDALSAIDEEFAEREATYSAWCDMIGTMTLKKLEEELDKAQQELAKAEADAAKNPSSGNQQKVATARAKVKKAQDTITEKKADQDVKPAKGTAEDWVKVADAIGEAGDSLKSLGDTIEGTVGEALSAAGTIASSASTMINGIVQLVSGTTSAIQTTSTAAAAAIRAVESATVILAIVEAAMQIANTIVNMFKDDSKQKEIEALQDRIDELQWELDNQDILRTEAAMGGITYLDIVTKSIKEATSETIKAAIETNNWKAAWNAITQSVATNNQLLAASAKKIADAYADIGYTQTKAFGDDRYNTARSQLENIAQQQALINQQMEDEIADKDTDWDKVTEYQEKIEELGQEAATLISDMMEDMLGTTAEDIAQELSDAFVEAFASGEDAVEAFGDKAQEVVGEILKQLIVQNFLEGPVGKILETYQKKWFPDGNFVGLDTVIADMDAFSDDLTGLVTNYGELMTALPQEIQDLIYGTVEREAESSGIATASQDSVDELNGRATAIQSHTFSISENTKLLVENTQELLRSVMHIESETDGFGARLERMETSLRSVNNQLEDINTRGIKIKN